MVKILVTGSCGFISSHLIESLVQANHLNYIVGFDCMVEGSNLENKYTGARKHQVKYFISQEFQKDIDNPDFYEDFLNDHKPDIIYNIAALSHVDTSLESPLLFQKYNSSSTNALLEACVKTKFKGHFIHMSTDEVFGSINDGKVTEDGLIYDFNISKMVEAPYNPSSVYSQTKVAQEQLCKIYSDTYGLNITTVRSTNVFGKNQDLSKFIPKTINALKNGTPVKLYSKGEQKRTWIHVADLVNLLLKFVDCDESKRGLIYHCSSQNELTNYDLIQKIVKLMELDNYSINYVKDRPNHDFRYSLGTNETRKLLDWQSIINFEKGLLDTIKFYSK